MYKGHTTNVNIPLSISSIVFPSVLCFSDYVNDGCVRYVTETKANREIHTYIYIALFRPALPRHSAIVSSS